MLAPALLHAAEPRELTYATPHTEFQKLFDKQLKRKFVPVDIASYYLTPASLQFAAIWEPRAVGDVQVRVTLTRDALKQQVTDFGNKGYRLEHLSGTGAGGAERYNAVWNKIPGQQVVIRYGFPQKALLAEHLKQTEKKFVLHRVTAVEIDNAIRFTAVWDNDGIGRRELDLGMSATRLKRSVRNRAKAGFRLRQLCVYVERRAVKYGCIWEKAAGPAQELVTGMNVRTLQKTHEEMTANGFRPRQILGYGINRRDRFVGVWEKVARTK